MVNYIKVTVPEEYPYVLLFVGLISFQCLVMGFVASAQRNKLFS